MRTLADGSTRKRSLKKDGLEREGSTKDLMVPTVLFEGVDDLSPLFDARPKASD
jgi:hypothetical protein